MEVALVKEKETIKLYIDGKESILKKPYCYVLGNIYNIDEIGKIPSNITLEEKVLQLYSLYKEKLFSKLSGEYALILVVDDVITLVRDRMGSKQLYYTSTKDTFVCTTNLSFISSFYRGTLEIDKQSVANYLCYSYIASPYTIYKNVYKVDAGNFVRCKKQTVLIKKYYNLVNQYIRNKNKLLRMKKVEQKLEESLKRSVATRVDKKQKIGIFFSAGIDSTLIASLAKDIPGKEIHTYTVGFYDEDRNEALKAKKIASYLKTQHHEFYIDEKEAKNIVYELPKVYTEPFADPSMIPTFFLSKRVDKKVDIFLTGDGADQLFCGSNVYDRFNIVRRIKYWIVGIKGIVIDKKNRKIAFKKIYDGRRYTTSLFMDIEPKSYYDLPWLSFKKQIKYMLFDIKTFLANRLFTKMYAPAEYTHITLSHPFVDNDFVEATFKVAHKYKYHKRNKKYILKKILYKKIPRELLNHKKQGFGIPLKKWIYTLYKEDIIFYSDREALCKQDIFSISKMQKIIEKLNKEKLSNEEAYTLFAYYMFQIWYQQYIEDIWTIKEDT